MLSLPDRNIKHLICPKTYCTVCLLLRRPKGHENQAVGWKDLRRKFWQRCTTSGLMVNLLCIMWLISSLCSHRHAHEHTHLHAHTEECQMILFVDCVSFQMCDRVFHSGCCHLSTTRSRLTPTCLFFSSADDYEEHNMDSTDAQHDKGVLQIFSSTDVLSRLWHSLFCSSLVLSNVHFLNQYLCTQNTKWLNTVTVPSPVSAKFVCLLTKCE